MFYSHALIMIDNDKSLMLLISRSKFSGHNKEEKEEKVE